MREKINTQRINLSTISIQILIFSLYRSYRYKFFYTNEYHFSNQFSITCFSPIIIRIISISSLSLFQLRISVLIAPRDYDPKKKARDIPRHAEPLRSLTFRFRFFVKPAKPLIIIVSLTVHIIDQQQKVQRRLARSTHTNRHA